MAEPLLIGVDLGTTNGKVACYDLQGRLWAEAARTYPTYRPRPGWHEQDPRDWIAALGSALREVSDQLGPRVEDVAALSVSSFGPGLVMLDSGGEPLAHCPTWQDERSRPQGQRLVEAVGADWIGPAPPLTGFPAKLLWAIEEMPDQIAHAAWVLGIKDYLLYWLTGEIVTEPSSISGGKEWYVPVFEYIGWPLERLPRVIASTASPGGLRKDLAQQVGLSPDTPVFAGLNDGAAATLGSGAVHVGESVATLATNGVARLVLAERIPSHDVLRRHLFTWPYVAGLWVGGGITHSGAGSLQWLADQLGLPRDPAAYDALLAETAAVPRGSAGVTFLPYLAGRGTPEADPDLRGGFVGVGLEHGRAHLVRAVLEGIAFALREIYAEFERLGMAVGPVRLTGGGARSALWRQILADVLQRPIIRAGGDSTLGVAIVAAVGLGFYPDFATATRVMVKPLSHEIPDPEGVGEYTFLFDAFVRTRDALLNAPRARVTHPHTP